MLAEPIITLLFFSFALERTMALNSSRAQARAENAKSESLSDVNHLTFKILGNSEELGAVMLQAGERMVVSNYVQDNSRRSFANRK